MRVLIESDGENVTGKVAHNDDGNFIELSTKKEKDFLAQLTANNQYNIGLLPPAVRWISPDKSIVVFERPPMRQLVEFLPLQRDKIREDFDYRGKGHYCSYQLNIPWTVYLACFDNSYLPNKIKVFTRNEPLQNMDDTLGLLPLLNFYYSSQLCNPGLKHFEGMPANLGEGINMAYNLIWNSGWNLDLHDAVNLGMKTHSPVTSVSSPGTKYTQAELRAQAYVSIVNFHKNWASLSMDEVLRTTWAPPQIYNHQGPLTLSKAIALTQKENIAELPNQARTFMVNLVSSLV